MRGKRISIGMPKMIGKRCAWNKGKRLTAAQLATRTGRKRSEKSRERMRQAAQRREARRLRVKLHELRTRRLFPDYRALQRLGSRIERGAP
jgi:hypothetical protein